MAKRKKAKIQINRIRARRSYSTKEIADLLGCDVQTIRSWRRQGMRPIDPGQKPFLFIGAEIKRFLTDRRKKRKTKLKEDEYYCPHCRCGRRSTPGKIRIVFTNRRMGKNDWQVIIKGECDECGCRLNRFATRNGLKVTYFERFVTKGH